jgi:hypothetical protein
MYFVEGSDTEENKYKFSSKVIQKDKNDLTKERFQNVLNDPKNKDMCINRGFRVIDNHMITYTQEKKGMSYYYDKRIVLSDGVRTLPLPSIYRFKIKSFGGSCFYFDSEIKK